MCIFTGVVVVGGGAVCAPLLHRTCPLRLPTPRSAPRPGPAPTLAGTSDLPVGSCHTPRARACRATLEQHAVAYVRPAPPAPPPPTHTPLPSPLHLHANGHDGVAAARLNVELVAAHVAVLHAVADDLGGAGRGTARRTALWEDGCADTQRAVIKLWHEAAGCLAHVFVLRPLRMTYPFPSPPHQSSQMPVTQAVWAGGEYIYLYIGTSAQQHVMRQPTATGHGAPTSIIVSILVHVTCFRPGTKKPCVASHLTGRFCLACLRLRRS